MDLKHMFILTPEQKELAKILRDESFTTFEEIASRLHKSIETTKTMAAELYKAYGVDDRYCFTLFFKLPLDSDRMKFWISK